MSGGIGGIGNLGINQMSSIAKSPTDMMLLDIHKKKKTGGDTSFEMMLVNLNQQNTSGIHAGAQGEKGIHINKFA